MSYNHNGTYVCKNCGKEVFVNVMEEAVPKCCGQTMSKNKRARIFP